MIFAMGNSMNFLSSLETSKKLKISYATLANWRVIGKGPPYIKIGGGVLYDPQEVEKYIKENTHAKSKKPLPSNNGKSRKSRRSIP